MGLCAGKWGQKGPAPKVAQAEPPSPRPADWAAEGGHAPASPSLRPGSSPAPRQRRSTAPTLPGKAEGCSPQSKPGTPQAASGRRQHSSAGGKVTRGSVRKRRSGREQASWNGRSSRQASKRSAALTRVGSRDYALGGATRKRTPDLEAVTGRRYLRLGQAFVLPA